jgi:hypothetical protein
VQATSPEPGYSLTEHDAIPEKTGPGAHISLE